MPLRTNLYITNNDVNITRVQILISCFVKTSHFEEYLRVKVSSKLTCGFVAEMLTLPFHFLGGCLRILISRDSDSTFAKFQDAVALAGDNPVGFVEGYKPPRCTSCNSNSLSTTCSG
jgi:hypothetical protein